MSDDTTAEPGDRIRREQLVTQTFLLFADTLVADFDIIELLTMLTDRCNALVDAHATGILLADPDGNLCVVAASSEQARLVELFQLQNEEGPCLEAFQSGQAVVNTDLRGALDRWPQFTPYAVGAGYESVYALPLRLRNTIIGALNLFRNTTAPMPADDVLLAQALADIASIAVLQDQAAQQTRIRNGQLQNALGSRISIERAKGMLAERSNIDMATAFGRIRAYARNNNMQLTEAAKRIIAGTITLDEFDTPKSRRPR
jgi:GAF domain-containing protein